MNSTVYRIAAQLIIVRNEWSFYGSSRRALDIRSFEVVFQSIEFQRVSLTGLCCAGAAWAERSQAGSLALGTDVFIAVITAKIQ